MRAVRRLYGHNEHIGAILSAQYAAKLEHEGANRNDDVLVWPLDKWLLKLELKLNLKMISDNIFLNITLKKISSSLNSF